MFRKRFRLRSLRKHPTRHHWFSREMTSEERAQKLHTDDVLLPRSGRSLDWSCCEGHLPQPIRSIAQIWVLTRNQYGLISALVPQTSLMGKPVLSLQIMSCFFRLAFDMLSTFYRLKSQNYRFSTDLQRREKINFSLLVFTFAWARYNAYFPRNFLILSQVPCHILWIHLCSCHALSQALFLPAPTETRWSELINIIQSRQDKKRINKWRQRGGGKRKKEEERRGQICTFLSPSSQPFFAFSCSIFLASSKHMIWRDLGGKGPPSVYLPLINGIPFCA